MIMAPDGDERAALLHFLAANRRAAVDVVEGLSEADARRSVVPSGWTAFDLVAECERSEEILRGFALDDRLTLQPAELVGEVTTVRGVLLHVIEEVARHAGHLDLARELLDGRTGLGPR